MSNLLLIVTLNKMIRYTIRVSNSGAACWKSVNFCQKQKFDELSSDNWWKLCSIGKLLLCQWNIISRISGKSFNFFILVTRLGCEQKQHWMTNILTKLFDTFYAVNCEASVDVRSWPLVEAKHRNAMIDNTLLNDHCKNIWTAMKLLVEWRVPLTNFNLRKPKQQFQEEEKPKFKLLEAFEELLQLVSNFLCRPAPLFRI